MIVDDKEIIQWNQDVLCDSRQLRSKSVFSRRTCRRGWMNLKVANYSELLRPRGSVSGLSAKKWWNLRRKSWLLCKVPRRRSSELSCITLLKSTLKCQPRNQPPSTVSLPPDESKLAQVNFAKFQYLHLPLQWFIMEYFSNVKLCWKK